MVVWFVVVATLDAVAKVAPLFIYPHRSSRAIVVRRFSSLKDAPRAACLARVDGGAFE